MSRYIIFLLLLEIQHTYLRMKIIKRLGRDNL